VELYVYFHIGLSLNGVFFKQGDKFNSVLLFLHLCHRFKLAAYFRIVKF
jgi:hypothetical protein